MTKKKFDFLRICRLFIIFALKILTIMVVTFNEDYLEKLYSKGENGKQHDVVYVNSSGRDDKR